MLIIELFTPVEHYAKIRLILKTLDKLIVIISSLDLIKRKQQRNRKCIVDIRRIHD